MLSLHTFAGRAITLDLARDRLIVESRESLEARTRELSPHAARALGLTSGDTSTVDLMLAPSLKVAARARSREIIYDGVISAAMIERGVYTFDLATGRAWFKTNDAM